MRKKSIYLLATILFLFTATLAKSQIIGGTAVCENETVTYYAPPATGASYSWSLTGGAGTEQHIY